MGGRLFPRWAGSALILLVVLGLVGGYIAFVATRSPEESAGPPPGCHVSLDAATYTLELDQTAHATTIAAVAKRMGMPNHAVTVALATALQESKLRNLDYGDRDSLGLFQQRPSQGWGTPEEVMTPHHAAATFYERLARVEGWDHMPVTTAAQHVQRSAAPDAYAKWEHQARAIAIATTGEVPAGLACRVDVAPASDSRVLRLSITRELGAPALEVPLPDGRGWTAASWLVGHAGEYGITSVAYAGHIWTPSTGRWLAYGGPVDAVVRVSQAEG
jgi:hypothetical protein